MLLFADADRQFVDRWVDLNGLSNSGAGRNQDSSDEIPTKFRSQIEAIVTSQVSIGEMAPSTLLVVNLSVLGK